MSTVVRYASPVSALINDFFKTAYEQDTRTASFRPAIDIIEQEKEYHLYADLAGFTKEDLTITVDNGTLAISGEKKRVESEGDRYRHFERNFGRFERKFNIPDEIDTDGISAEMNNGELKITIAKKEKALPKKIDIAIR